MDEQAAQSEGWLARVLSAIDGAWVWWTGLFGAYAWQEIGAYLVPALAVIVVLMFWGIRRMQQGD